MKKTLLIILALGALCAAGAAQQRPQQKKIVPNDADVAFVASMAESAARQYNAMTPAERHQVEQKVVRLLPKDVDPVLTIQAMRAYCARTQKGMTAEDKAIVRAVLNEYPSWCAVVKATRYSRSGMRRLGMPCKELSIQDMLNLMPN